VSKSHYAHGERFETYTLPTGKCVSRVNVARIAKALKENLIIKNYILNVHGISGVLFESIHMNQKNYKEVITDEKTKYTVDKESI
jgi:hypothetical protein